MRSIHSPVHSGVRQSLAVFGFICIVTSSEFALGQADLADFTLTVSDQNSSNFFDYSSTQGVPLVSDLAEAYGSSDGNSGVLSATCFANGGWYADAIMHFQTSSPVSVHFLVAGASAVVGDNFNYRGVGPNTPVNEGTLSFGSGDKLTMDAFAEGDGVDSVAVWAFGNNPLPGSQAPTTQPTASTSGISYCSTNECPADADSQQIVGTNLVNVNTPVSGAYGQTNPIYAGPNPALLPSLFQAAALPAASLNASAVASSYSFDYHEESGNKFTTFAVPLALVTGETSFTVQFGNFTETYKTGTTLDFTQFVPGGVTEFKLLGFDGMQPASDGSPPFVWGCTYGSAGSADVFINTVPEPSSIALLTIGAIGFVAMARREHGPAAI